MFVLYAVSALADPWTTDPQPFQVVDVAPVFDAVAFDSGYWPSVTDPIAIRFYVTPDGGVTTSLLGTSELRWPEFEHRFADQPGGIVELDGGVTIGSDIQIDLLGIFTGVVTLAEERVGFQDAEVVDGLLLPDDRNDDAPTVSVGDGVEVIPALDYAFNIVPGVDLVVGITVTPTVQADLSAASLSGGTTDLLWFQQEADAWIGLEPDPDRPGEFGIVATWSADLFSVLSIVLEPSVAVHTAVGDFELLSIPIPIDLGSTDERREPEPQFIVHPLPVIADLASSLDFGEVRVGDEATYSLPIVDIGQGILQGSVTVVGGDDFSSWPTEIVALPDSGDGLTIAFAPTAAGAAEAELWIETNDPTRPLVQILLAGTGVLNDAPAPDGLVGVAGGTGPATFCGCGSDPSPHGPWVASVALLILLRRRTTVRRAPDAVSRTSGSLPPR